MSSIATFRYGTATVSFVEQPYGRNRRRVMSNAPLCRNGIDDMIAALTEARDHLDGDDIA